ncbi:MULTISPECIES: hypothetical protein [unclassified Bradyrhizobium]|uniref:hypothetical protein n=1 Tax=unclassified Bradyrhizobium TaxID=2631580 RepID=UPI0028E757BC|nr:MULTISPECIES: hypothetical protein [unclassified Bradyrhizobium]
MTIYAIVSGLGAAILLLTSGYLFGARQGALSRELLRRQVQIQAASLDQLQEQSSHDAIERETSLRSAIEDVLAPLVERERISLDLAQLASRPGRRRELVPLLDRIAEVGRFQTVLLTNEEGLPLAANTTAHRTEQLAAAATRLALVAEKIADETHIAPLSVMLRDASEATTLCRIFRVQDQTLTLTALSNDARLASVALDPALAKVQVALTAPA